MLLLPLLLTDTGDRPEDADRGMACLRRFWALPGLGVGVRLPPAAAGGEAMVAATAAALAGALTLYCPAQAAQ